ncbi:MAG: hypothetical protein WC613_02155 [Candidatus Aenigmatarchaeota archaeon]
MDPLIREYLDSKFSLNTRDDHHDVLFDGRYMPFRVDNDCIQLLKYVPSRTGSITTPGRSFVVVYDNSKTPEQVYAMFRYIAMNWIHEKALRMLEDERHAQYHDTMRGSEVSFSLRDDVEEIEACYDTRV